VLTYSALVAEEGIVSVTFAGSNMTMTEVGSGTTTVTVTADDSFGGTVSDSFTVLISENAVPAIDAPLEDMEYEAGFLTATIDLANRFTDGDGDPITLSASVLDETVVAVALSGTTLTITEVAAGNTTITITADDGNGGVVSERFDVTVAPMVLGQQPEINLSFYPNPASSSIHLTIGRSHQLESIHILDLNGKRREGSTTIEGSTTQIDIESLTPGMYFLQMKIDGKKAVRRFLKEN